MINNLTRQLILSWRFGNLVMNLANADLWGALRLDVVLNVFTEIYPSLEHIGLIADTTWKRSGPQLFWEVLPWLSRFVQFSVRPVSGLRHFSSNICHIGLEFHGFLDPTFGLVYIWIRLVQINRNGDVGDGRRGVISIQSVRIWIGILLVSLLTISVLLIPDRIVLLLNMIGWTRILHVFPCFQSGNGWLMWIRIIVVYICSIDVDYHWWRLIKIKLILSRLISQILILIFLYTVIV